MSIVRELHIAFGPEPITNLVRLTSPAGAAAVLYERLKDEPTECGVVLLLNIKNDCLGLHEVSRGGLSGTSLHPREVFRAAIMTNAYGIVVGHNHPSGDPTPSKDDLNVAHGLIAAGKVLHIEVLDFIIVGAKGQFFSFVNRKNGASQ